MYVCLYVGVWCVQGEHYDGRKADTWSCGVILYALLVVSTLNSIITLCWYVL